MRAEQRIYRDADGALTLDEALGRLLAYAQGDEVARDDVEAVERLSTKAAAKPADKSRRPEANK